MKLLALIGATAVALAGASADRASKIYFLAHPAAGGVVADGWLRFRLATNANLAFSLPFPPALTTILAAAVLVVFVWWWTKAWQRRELPTATGLAFVVAGAASNLVDRWRWGHVVDYIDVPWFTVFNLADVMISVGVGLLIIQELIRWIQWKRKIAV